MNNACKVLIALAVGTVFFARQAAADVVFEETTSQSGMPMGGGSGVKTKVLISGDKYRAQKKLTIDKAAMGDQMKFQQQMGGVNMGMMNKINRAGMPAYPDHVMTLDEWGDFDENAKLMKEAADNIKGSSGLGGQLKGLKGVGGLFGKKKDEKPPVTANDVLRKYCDELDAGILAKKQDEAADKMAQGGGMGGMIDIAQATDYDTWLRVKIIRDACPDPKDVEDQKKAMGSSGFGGGAKKTSFADMQKISDDKSSEYASLKRDYDKKSELKAEYAKNKEKNKEMAASMDKKMSEGMAGAADAANDMMLNVQIVRLDTGKVIEVFPPKNGKSPKPEEVTYKEETLADLKDKVDEAAEKKAKMMKANEGKMKDADAKMAAARAKYGDQVGGGKPEAKNLGSETVNGIPCEHWQVSGMTGMDDYWVSSKFAGADEIMAFEAKLKAKIGEGRSGLSFGGMPDMSSMMGGMDPAMDAEVAKIKERGIVIKHVNTMKNAAPTQGAMLQNQKAVSGDIGDAGAAQKMQSMDAMKNMTPAQKMAMMKDPAMMQQMMGGAKIGAAAQASAEKHQAAGDMNTTDRQDMTSTYELKLVGSGPVPAAAFEPPAGAKKK